MALFNKPSSVLAAMVMAMVFTALMSDVANASSLTVWRGPGCKNNSERYRCGCDAIKYHGGYSFAYTGQPGYLYNEPGCRGRPDRVFRSPIRSCNGFGWKSFFTGGCGTQNI